MDLYYFPASPPSRAVLLLVRALKLTVNKKLVNIFAGDQLKPEYLKLNPTHTIPTLNDNGFVLWERYLSIPPSVTNDRLKDQSAILEYLATAYGKNLNLVPTDPKANALIKQRLYYDDSTLFATVAQYVFPVCSTGIQPIPENLAKVKESLQILDGLMENCKYVAGDTLSIADFSIVTTISTVEAVGIDIDNYPNISGWYERIKKEMEPFDYEEINQKGADMVGDAFKSKIKA